MAKLKDYAKEWVAAGYANPEGKNPHLWSSYAWEAHFIGQYLAASGRGIAGLEKGRGSQWFLPSGCRFQINYARQGEGLPVAVERIA
jgi:hypothetical protein